jgi:long-chain fatty acid transport protein
VKKGRVFFSTIILFMFLSSMALANGLNLNSVGSRAFAMGGAFVGLADDFSALHWNPAGIAQFDKKYFGFYGTDVIPSGTYKLVPELPGLGKFTLVNAKTERKHYLVGMAAYYHPISENMVFGFGVYTPAGLGSNWSGEDFVLVAMNNPNLKWMSKIGLVTFAPALAYKVSEQIFVGAALNINYGIFDVGMHAGSQDLGVDLGQYEESMSGWGYGATFGVLVKPNEKFSLGATFRTASTIKFSGEAEISNLNVLGQIPGSPFFGATIETKSDLDREVTWPMWLAGGVAFRPAENLILTADLQWTQWSKIENITTDYKHPFWALFMELSGDDVRKMDWKDALQIRFGAEYKINTVAIRGGYYWDPSPAPDQTMNVLLPNYDFNVITAGFGYSLDGLQIDFAVEYLMGKERNVPFDVVPLGGLEFNIVNASGYEAAMPGLFEMNIFAGSISVSYKF